MLKLFRRGAKEKEIEKEKTQEAVEPTRRRWFGNVFRTFDRSKVDEEFWEALEEMLILADVGIDTTARLLEGMRERVEKEKLSDAEAIRSLLKEEMVKMLTVDSHGEESLAPDAAPQVLLVIGVNGVGKTTSIAKLADSFREEGKKVLLAAADTFRAAAIEQLAIWGDRVGTEVIAHRPGADPGAVVYDAFQAAKSRGADVLIIDTAGRLHTKFNLMQELKKIQKVLSRVDSTAPHEVILVIDAMTGQNGLSQAKHFVDAVGVTGIFLAKLDGTAKGGIVLTICDELKVPILFIGTGEGLDDLARFDARDFVEALFSQGA